MWLKENNQKNIIIMTLNCEHPLFGMHMSEICMYSKHYLSNNNIEKIITVTIVTCFPYVKMANDSIVITCHFAKYFRQVGYRQK